MEAKTFKVFVLNPEKMLTFTLVIFCLFDSKVNLYKFYLLLKSRLGPISSKDVMYVPFGLW